MLFNLQLYLQTIFPLTTWLLKPTAISLMHLLSLRSFTFLIRIFNIESLEEARLFNYFYLARYFFGFPAKVFFLKEYFVLGRTYYNTEIGFHLQASRFSGPLTVWIFHMQPLINMGLTRDFSISPTRLQWVLKDPSIFSERKTNTGLFYLADPISLYLNYREVSPSSIYLTQKMLSSLKLILN